MPQVAAAWTPEVGARFKQPDAASSLRGYCRVGIGPCSSVLAGFNAECAAYWAILLRLPLVFLNPAFFMRPSAKGRRLRALEEV